MTCVVKWSVCLTLLSSLWTSSAGESDGRDSRGKNYVPINSLTIATILKENPEYKASSNSSTFKPWWSDLQTESKRRREKRTTYKPTTIQPQSFDSQDNSSEETTLRITTIYEETIAPTAATTTHPTTLPTTNSTTQPTTLESETIAPLKRNANFSMDDQLPIKDSRHSTASTPLDGALLNSLQQLEMSEPEFFASGASHIGVQITNKGGVSLESLSENWHGINKSIILNSGHPQEEDLLSTRAKEATDEIFDNPVGSSSPLYFVQQTLLKDGESEFDMKPLATLTTSPTIASTTPTTDSTLSATVSPLIPTYYHLPDDDSIRSLLQKFMEIIRKQDIEKKTPGIVKTVFFNLLVDIGKNKDEKIINRILRHYSTHFQRKHQDNKRRFLLKNPDFNHASDLIDELFREFTSRPQPLITTVATVPRVTTNPQATLSNLDLVPMSILGANKKASIIKVDKPFPMDEHVQQNLENVRQPQIMRSSEPTPIINKGPGDFDPAWLELHEKSKSKVQSSTKRPTTTGRPHQDIIFSSKIGSLPDRPKVVPKPNKNQNETDRFSVDILGGLTQDVEIAEEEVEIEETDRQNIAAFFDRDILPNNSLELSHEVADRHRDTTFMLQNPDDGVVIENGRPPFHDDEKDYAENDEEDMVDLSHEQEDPSIFPENIELEYKDDNLDEQPPTIMMGHSGEEDYAYPDDEDSNFLNENNEDDDSKVGLPRNPDRYTLSHSLQTSIMRPDFTEFVVNTDQNQVSGHKPGSLTFEMNGTKAMANGNHDYFPQLSNQNDHVDISQLVGLKPNFTQTHKGNYYSTKPTPASRKPWQNQKQKIPHPQLPTNHPQNSFDRPGMTIQELMDDFDKVHLDIGMEDQETGEKLDRFAADILNPAPSKPKLPIQNGFSWTPRHQNLTTMKPESNRDPGNVVSVDEWKSILINRLTSAISKVAASPNLPHILHQTTPYTTTTRRPLPNLDILDDNYYHQNIGSEKRNGSVIVNVWDNASGSLKPVGKKPLRQTVTKNSGAHHELDFDDYSNFYSDFVDHLFDNEIPAPDTFPNLNHPISAYGVGNKSPDVTTQRPLASPPTQRVSNIQGFVEGFGGQGLQYDYPFRAPVAIKSDTHKQFSSIGTFTTTTIAPIHGTSRVGNPLRNKNGLSPPVVIASIFGIPMNLSFTQDEIPDITSAGPVHIPPELKLFGDFASYLSKPDKKKVTPTIPPDLLENNQLLNIYPQRAAALQKAQTSTSPDSTAPTMEDNLDDGQTHPRWKDFPFLAESISTLRNRSPSQRPLRPKPIFSVSDDVAPIRWQQPTSETIIQADPQTLNRFSTQNNQRNSQIEFSNPQRFQSGQHFNYPHIQQAGQNFQSYYHSDLAPAGTVQNRFEQQIKDLMMPETRFKSPPVMMPLPKNQKQKNDDQFVILDPQVLPDPQIVKEQESQKLLDQQRRILYQQASEGDMIYDSNNLSYFDPPKNNQLLDYLMKKQLVRGK